jgi:hypothetical protein
MTTRPPAQLLLEFSGWCLMRIPTDPDPTDEPRGVSGYSFAFGGEPDLDRLIRLQPPKELVRTHAPEMGVFVRKAERHATGPDGGVTEVPRLVGAAVDLEGGPKLENRNWTLTLPGYEPIVPFNLRIRSGVLDIYREAPIDPEDPSKPVWQVSPDKLAVQAASGMNPEPDTIGRATGMRDPYQVVVGRLAALEQDLAALPPSPENANARAVIEGRIAQLRYARDNPDDRRVANRVTVERFSFPMVGTESVITGDQETVLGGTLDTDKQARWMVAFWIGAWDPDLLSAFMEGSLLAPYATVTG